MDLLELKNVSYTKDEKIILQDISLKVESSDFISVVGPSGSGKSTMFRLCSDLTSYTQGEILYKSKLITEYNPIQLRKEICYCFQTPYLFGNNVMDNIKFPYSIREEKIDLVRVQELFSLFNLGENLLNSEVKNLSGGEKQRISLIRALLFRPQLILLDEITSALDVDNVNIVENAISILNKQGITVMWITHNPEQSRRYANKLVTLDKGTIKAVEVLG